MDAPPLAPRRSHVARLMSIWRSAGWPSRDAIELDLLAAGWVARAPGLGGQETLHVTEAGMQVMAAARAQRQASLGAHARLAARVCTELIRAGRIVWRELRLRAKAMDVDPVACACDADPATASAALPGEAGAIGAAMPPVSRRAWRSARPDVFSIRHTSVEDYLHPMVHEVKVKRADLLADLRDAAKGASYRWLSCETYYVFPREVAKPEEVPEPYGVWILNGAPEHGTLEMVRRARHVPCRLPFPVWMALARSTPSIPEDEGAQMQLGSPGWRDAAEHCAARPALGPAVP